MRMGVGAWWSRCRPRYCPHRPGELAGKWQHVSPATIPELLYWYTSSVRAIQLWLHFPSQMSLWPTLARNRQFQEFWDTLSSLANLAYCQATGQHLGITQKIKWQPSCKTYAPTKLLQATNLNPMHLPAVKKRVLYQSECWQKQKADPKGLTPESLRKGQCTDWWAELRTNKGWWHGN